MLTFKSQIEEHINKEFGYVDEKPEDQEDQWAREPYFDLVLINRLLKLFEKRLVILRLIINWILVCIW